MTLNFKTFETFFRMGGHPPTNRRARKRTLAGITLAFSLLVTVFASLQVKQGIEQAAVRQFVFACGQVTLKIQERLDANALILRGGGALFAASKEVERKEWQAYVENLQAEQSVPGVQGIGFAQVIPADQLANHIAKIRSEGFPDYTVKPPGERTLYTSVIYLEPFRERNLRAFGYDMSTEPVRQAAMEQARDTGEAALSGKVKLVQETGTDDQAGVIMVVPVYRNDAPISSVEQRRSALLGWVYSSYRMNDLMAGILADWERHEGKTVDLAIYDGPEATPANLLFDSNPAHLPDKHSLFYRQKTITFNGQPWLLVFDYTGKLSALSYLPAWATLAGGLALSGLLFGLIRSVINTRFNAARIAEGLTTEIRQAQEKIHLLLNSTAEAIYGINTDGDCTFCNNACLHLLGYQHPDDLLGKNMHWQIHGKHADGTYFPVEECRIFQAFKKGERMHVDDEVLWRSDGTSFPAEYWSYPESDKGEVVGAVVTFLDITERRQAEAAIQDAREYAENIVETMREPLVVLNADLKILTANSSFYNTFKVTPEKTIGNFIYDLGDRQWDIPKLRVLIEDILPNATVFNNYEVDHDFPGIGRKFILLNAREIVREGIGSRIILLVMEDITERKLLENERSKALFNKIASRVPGIVYQYRLRPDGSSYMPFASEAIRELFRVSPEEACEDASKVFAIIHADDYSSTVASLQKSAQNLTPWRHEYRIKFDDGTVCWMFGDALPEREMDGSTLWHGFITDITERKRMQDDLARREAEMRTTLYSIGDAVISLDIKGCVLLMNPVAEQLTGWSEPEAHGKPLEEVFCIINEKTRAKIDNPVTLVLNKGRNVEMMVHTVLIARDGTERSIGDSAAPIFDPDHHLIGVVLVFRDLTKARAAEEVILDQLAIIETYQGLVALADLDGKFIYINAGGTKLLGATQAEEILTKNMTDLLEPTDFKRVTDEALPVAIKDRVWNGEHTLKRIDGTRIPVSQTVFPIRDAEGNLRHIGMIIMDISLQKAMQDKLLISEKLAVMGRLVADVSHELNNPLAVIIGRTQLMLSQSDGQQLSLKSQLETVLQNAERCKTILSNLLTYSRTIGKQEAAVNLLDLIKEAVDAVTYQYDMSTIEVAVACNLPAYTKITGNKDALLSVFVNLIRNARQAMAQTGKLTITVAKENESQLRIEIHDTGIGISKERLEKIFQPFNSGWQQDKGTGLGLVTSLGIIETHGGKLWAESAGEGQGAKFIILLPHRNRKTQAINGLED